MNYKIVMDYAYQEVNKREGSKISYPEEYEKALSNYERAKKEFIRAMNIFCDKNFEPLKK